MKIPQTLAEQKICFDELLAYTDGGEINRQATAKYKEQNPNSYNTIYGEATFDTIAQILSHSAISNDVQNAKVFYDLGSGVGNVAIATAILGYFQKIHGIELMELLHNNALFLQNTLFKAFPELANKIKFHNTSFLDYDFSDADIIFANHPIRLEYTDILIKLEEKFQKLKKGTIILYSIRSLNNTKNFEKILSTQFPFSWGNATVYGYRKIA